MHDTAFALGARFFEIYLSASHRRIVEIGSLDINGSLRRCCPDYCSYIGLDSEHGEGVDIKIDLAQRLPLRSAFSDITITTSQMEHDPAFWNTFVELCRITRVGGFIYLNAPSNGYYHRYPIDVWRFYPDAGHALCAWAQKSGFNVELIESFIAPRDADVWNDFVAIFYVGTWDRTSKLTFLADQFKGWNVWKIGEAAIQNEHQLSEDQELLRENLAERARHLDEVASLKLRIAEIETSIETLQQRNAELERQYATTTDSPNADAPKDSNGDAARG